MSVAHVGSRLFLPEKRTHMALPLFLSPIRAGFPSPADDYVDLKLDLNDYLVEHPSATFFLRVEGDSMTGAGIHPGDILIADRAIEPRLGHVVVAVVNGEFTVKRYCKIRGKIYLSPENSEYYLLEITQDMHLEIWGLIKHVIHAI